MSTPLLRVEGLDVRFGAVDAVRDLSFDVAAGETLALVGESGSGKSVAMLALLGLLPPSARVSGRARLEGTSLLGAAPSVLDAVRGRAMAIVFQEPQTALDPLYTVGSQIDAVLRHRRRLPRAARRERVLALLRDVGIAEPERRARSYPHELSGGQRQRVAIAMAMAAEPKLLIADEPTTALDVTVAARILDLLAELRARFNMAMILISHDLGLVARVADRVIVMERGVAVEGGATRDVLATPSHPYTRRLLAARLAVTPPDPVTAPPILVARDIRVSYVRPGGWFGRKHVFDAVDGVSLDLRPGETLGLVGESGSGKSTLGRALLRLQPARGLIRFEGRDLRDLDEAALRPLRKRFQIVFQDPFASLSPRLTIGEIVGEGLRIHAPSQSAGARRAAAAAALREVGLGDAFLQRRPDELSGGQRQRVAIARALILQPRLLVLDEPTSALDRSIQGDVLRLLRALQVRHDLAYLFITHDLGVVRQMAQRIAVMRDGRIIEEGPTAALLSHPRDAYTAGLVGAAARLDLPETTS